MVVAAPSHLQPQQYRVTQFILVRVGSRLDPVVVSVTELFLI